MTAACRRTALWRWSLTGLSGLASGLLATKGLQSDTRPGELLALYAPGVIFAALVLLPLLGGFRAKLWRGLGVTALSVATYHVAVRLSVAAGGTAAFLAVISGVGAAAAALMLLVPAALLKLRIRALPTVAAVLLGGLGGFAIGWPLDTHLSLSEGVETAIMVLGYVLWQCGVGFPLVREKLVADS